jgi:diguanylate cyclase (GGDEF)-like protein
MPIAACRIFRRMRSARWYWRALFASGFFGLALLVRVTVAVMHYFPMSPFFIAVLFATALAGWRLGAMVTVASVIIHLVLFGDGELIFDNGIETIRNTIFLFQCSCVILAIHIAQIAETRVASMRHQIAHDDLTQAVSRSAVIAALHHIIARHQRDPQATYAVLYMDVNKFKHINDTYGHHIGDRVLIEFARRLKDCARERDIVARLSGDEFALVITGYKDPAHVQHVADRICTTLEPPFVTDDCTIWIRASIGIAYGADHQTPEAILQAADTAMYQAKHGEGTPIRVAESVC